MNITKIVGGKKFSNVTATHVFQLPCNASCSSDFGFEKTSLYLSPGGNFFLAGYGGPSTRWAQAVDNHSWTSGKGLILLLKAEARALLEENDGPTKDFFDVEIG